MTHGAVFLSEHHSLFNSMSAVQQSSPDNPAMSPHPAPPHSSQRESQQTVLSKLSMPGTPLLHVVPDDVSTEMDHHIRTKGARRGLEVRQVSTCRGG